MKTLFFVALASLLPYSHGYLNPALLEQQNFKSSLDSIPKYKRNHAFVSTIFTAAAFAFGVDTTPVDAIDNLYAPSSSIHLAAEVKILDMSLPTYGDISQPKFDVENIKGVDDILTSSKSSGGGLPVATRKSSRKEKTAKVDVQEESKSNSDDSNGPGKYEIVDMNMPSYSGSTTIKEKSVFSFK